MDDEERHSVWTRFARVACESDPTPVKFVLMMAAYIIAAGFWVDRHCSFAACLYLERAFEWPIWAVLWTAYALLLTWRIFDRIHRPTSALGVNAFGVFLYGGIAFGSVYARWPHWPLASGGIALALAAFWVLARTKVNPGCGFRGD